MPKPKIDPDQLRALLDTGHTQADAARHFGVSGNEGGRTCFA